MVPLSFEVTTRAPSVDPVNLIPSTEVRQIASTESFESHLQITEQRKPPPPPNDDGPDTTSENPSDESPAADNPRPGPEADAKEDAPAEESETGEANGSAQKESAEESKADKTTTENDTVKIDAELALPIDDEADAEGPQVKTVEQDAPVVTIQPENEVSNELLPASTPEQDLELFEEDASGEEEGDTPTTLNLKKTSRTLGHDESNPDDTGGQTATSEQQVQVAAAANTEEAETGKRPTEHTPSADKPSGQRPVETTEVVPLPESSSQDSEADADARRENGAAPSVTSVTNKENDASGANTQRFAQHLVTQGGDGAKGVQLNHADQARFVDRVARAFRAAEGRNGIVRLRLSPPELGALRLEIKVQGGALAARLEADTPLARSLLLDNLPVLRERLAEQGIRVEQFDVELLDRQSHGDFDGWEQRHAEDGEPSEPNAASMETTEEPSSHESPGIRSGGDEQLNVVI